jgi:hypothetical protein
MKVAVAFDREASLDAMWRSLSAPQNPSIQHALLQATPRIVSD